MTGLQTCLACSAATLLSEIGEKLGRKSQPISIQLIRACVFVRIFLPFLRVETPPEMMSPIQFPVLLKPFPGSGSLCRAREEKGVDSFHFGTAQTHTASNGKRCQPRQIKRKGKASGLWQGTFTM